MPVSAPPSGPPSACQAGGGPCRIWRTTSRAVATRRSSAGEAETEKASTGEPREKLVASTQRPARRTGLLSTAAVVVVLAGIGGVAWAERQGTVSLPLPPKMVALLRTGLPSTTQVTGEVGVTDRSSPGHATSKLSRQP